MSNHKNGAVDSTQTIKAGCGIRYDPDLLGEDCGFDFTMAKELSNSDQEPNKDKKAVKKPDISPKDT